ncbi:uncharacterized protein LOC120682168 isoform X4 [Panicum virgatum]|uniref:uncharacterized protein LOC120682168 isoform X4 n=1 Tax=Panicum virgatum TaxID=38727 RepID=UPI0019D6A839|nr:uncharacterized protein LOC120682168 isoform X4 [Panicum virgatum]
MAMVGIVASTSFTYHKPRFAVVCRKNKDGRERERERDREKEHKHPFKVVEITPPPRCLGVRCFPTMILMAAVQPCAYGLLCEQEHNQEYVQPKSASFRFSSYAQTYLMHRECFFS